MNVWKLVSANKLVRSEAPIPLPEEGKIRVRVTKLLLNDMDARLVAGNLKTHYPVIPGRYAVGAISGESADPLFPKGTRVLLHTYRPADLSGTEKRDFTQEDLEVCGVSRDGFLSDFVLVSPDDMTALPASVSDERGLLIHHVAVAKAIVDKLGTQKGQHIAVVGANILGIFLCQLLIYQQAAPILIDASSERLDFARACGVYYTMKNDEKLLDAVASVTGGRLASGAVYVASAAGNEAELPFLLCGANGKTVFCGANAQSVNVNLELAMRRHLSLFCVTNGANYLKTAINLMANRAVDTSAFPAEIIRPDGVTGFFKNDPELIASGIHIVDLLS